MRADDGVFDRADRNSYSAISAKRAKSQVTLGDNVRSAPVRAYPPFCTRSVARQRVSSRVQIGVICAHAARHSTGHRCHLCRSHGLGWGGACSHQGLRLSGVGGAGVFPHSCTSSPIRAGIQHRLQLAHLRRVSLYRAPPALLEASACFSPVASARRHRFAGIGDTRNRRATSRSLAPVSISSAASCRTRSRRPVLRRSARRHRVPHGSGIGRCAGRHQS
jgi:hypothetical protein